MQVNKVVAAVLVSGIAFMGATLLSQGLVHPKKLTKSVVQFESPTAAPAAGKPAEEPPLAALLASADPKKGQADTASAGCVACHSFNEGGRAGIGPNLYGVVGAPHGHMEGYAYSAALKAKTGPWSYEALNEWLKKPAAYAPGTKMTYAGLPDPQKRAEVIAYLRTLSANPQPLPAAPAQPAAASAAPAAGAPAAGASAPAPAGGGDAPIETRMASADPKAGQSLTMKLGCIACHTFTQGGKAGLGPNLYGVVGAPHGHMEGYTYSSALKAKEGAWTEAELDKWLAKPAAYAPGTKMTYAGLPDPQKRADVIAYLRTLSPNAAPAPAAAPAAAAPAADAPAQPTAAPAAPAAEAPAAGDAKQP